MKQGFTKAWRKELESSIWLMPPIYHRVWYWLRLKVQYEPFLFPTRRLFGIWVLPGQRLTSIQQIAEGVKYFDNHRDIVPDKRTISRVLDWLEFNGCITVTSNACATLIFVINWDVYNVHYAEPVTDDVPPHALGHVPPHAHKEEGLRIKKKEKKEKEEGIKSTIPYVEILSKINFILGTRYKDTDTFRALVRARINEGFSPEDFETVCRKKFTEWGSDLKMMQYLRPETLFGKKMNDYLGSLSAGRPVGERERVNYAAGQAFLNEEDIWSSPTK